MSLNITAIENAIATWIIAASGIAAGRVRWAQQNPERPEGAGPWISLDIPAINQAGGPDWADPEPSPEPVTAGAEITYKLRGQRALPLTIQCFNGAGTGSSRAAAILDNCVAALASPTRRRALRAAGLGIGEVGPVRSMSGVLGSTRWEPRAVLQITLYAARESSETGTNLVSVEATGYVPTEADPDVTMELEVDAS